MLVRGGRRRVGETETQSRDDRSRGPRRSEERLEDAVPLTSKTEEETTGGKVQVTSRSWTRQGNGLQRSLYFRAPDLPSREVGKARGAKPLVCGPLLQPQ